MLNLKPFRENYASCGPASLKIVFEYFGVSKSEKEISELTKWTVDEGTTVENMVKAARSLGLQASYKDLCELDDIVHYVQEKKIPVIVDWFSVSDGHYSVVADIDKENIYLQDPELGRMRAIRLMRFRRIWFDFPGDYIQSKEDLILRRLIIIHK